MKNTTYLAIGAVAVGLLALSERTRAVGAPSLADTAARETGRVVGDAGVGLASASYSILQGVADAPYNAGVEFRNDLLTSNTAAIQATQQGADPLGFWFNRKVADFINNPFQPFATNPNNSAETLTLLSWLNPSV